MSAPYPTTAEVKAIFEIENGPNPDREKHLSHFDDKFEARAVSDTCPFPRRVDKQGFAQVLEMQEGWMHPDHHYDKHVGIVTGGGDNEWASVELFNSGKTHAGRALILLLLKFLFAAKASILCASIKNPADFSPTSRSRLQRPLPGTRALYPRAQNNRDESLS